MFASQGDLGLTSNPEFPESPWSVFTGATLALWSVSLIGIFVSATLLARVPKAWIHRAAAALFAVFGVLALVRAAAWSS